MNLQENSSDKYTLRQCILYFSTIQQNERFSQFPRNAQQT